MSRHRTIGILVFLLLLLFIILPLVAVPSMAAPGDQVLFQEDLATPTPAVEKHPTSPPDSREPLVPWANVELNHDRQSYLSVDPGEGGIQPTPSPSQPEPTPDEPSTPLASVSPDIVISSTMISYTVQSGDNLFRIARRHNVSLEELVAINSISHPEQISVGQRLIIPETTLTPSSVIPERPIPDNGLYIVQSGDFPYRIAHRFGLSLETLMALNDIPDPYGLRPGQVLRLSEDADTLPPTVEATPPSPTTEMTATGGTTYVVQQGDIPYQIAQRFDISVEFLLVTNNITDPTSLQIGQQLIIPAGGVILPSAPPVATTPTKVNPSAKDTYIVQQGDIPYQIARRFGISVEALLATNNITDPTSLQIGQVLFIPVPGASAPQPSPVALTAQPTASQPSEPIEFIWPLESRDISQYYQYGHGAIDIRTPSDSTVVAAAAGTVEFAGWNSQGYGYLVVIDHGNDFRTLYAHNSSLKVETGQTVTQGEIIALSGITGYSSGPHLHFEIILNYQLVNPCLYLPEGC